MKITWKLYKWIILAALIPVIFTKIHYAISVGFTDYNQLIKEILLSLMKSLIITSVLAFIILSEVNWLEKKLPWKKYQFKRILSEFFLTNITVVFLMTCFGIILYAIDSIIGFEDNLTLKEQILRGISIGVTLNLLLVSLAEGVFFFKNWKNSLILSERLEREKTQSQLEALKNQVNPHFLFNSLNVLSSLVHIDANKAEEFIDEFASIYRYILNIQGQSVVTLRDELHFLDSYIFLQKIRFKEGLIMQLDIDAKELNKFLPPLAMQMLVENAIKHNVVGKEQPLHIRIFTKNNSLYIINDVQLRQDKPLGTGIGLKNLRERYLKLAGMQPKFELQDDKYIAQIPLFKDNDEMQGPMQSFESFKCDSFNIGIVNKNQDFNLTN